MEFLLSCEKKNPKPARIDHLSDGLQAMPTRNGACDDVTSLQTGPRDLPYWDNARANGTLADAAFMPESWANLCWQHLSVELDAQSKLTVIYKGKTVLDHFQTSYFPSAGGIVLAGRTGGADARRARRGGRRPSPVS